MKLLKVNRHNNYREQQDVFCPMRLESISLHHDFPELVWVVVEQPRDEPFRLEYDPVRNTFIRSQSKSLLYIRGFSGAYGWIGGLGTPPEPHCDVILITHNHPKAGEVVLAHVCGIFFRRDQDHKVVALDNALRHAVPDADLFSLDMSIYHEVVGLYPKVIENEGWFGKQEACSYLRHLIT